MYLARTKQLGPHIDAVKYILHARGSKQFYDRSQFALWRVAHHRLQARQILHREGPDADQIEWVSKLNMSLPDIHISADVMHMNILNAAARKLTEDGEGTGVTIPEKN